MHCHLNVIPVVSKGKAAKTGMKLDIIWYPVGSYFDSVCVFTSQLVRSIKGPA